MNIERFLIQDLIRWKDSPRRKPLILNGVRQCGKTWLLKYFGQHYFEDFAYFNFEHSSEILSFFDGSYEPSKIITQLSAFANKQILPQKRRKSILQSTGCAITDLEFWKNLANLRRILS